MLKSVTFATKTLLVGSGRVVGGDEDWLKREIDLSAEIGMEYFFVDAGWYGTKLPMLPECLMYHHTPYTGFGQQQEWCVLEYASEDRKKIFAAIFKIEGRATDVYILYPKGLLFGKKYKVTLDNSGDSFELSGFEAITNGLRIQLDSELSSELLLFEQL